MESLTKVHIQQLFEQYYVALVEFSWRIVQCNETANDIVQDVFVKLLDKPYSLGSQSAAKKSYLFTTVKNASLNYLRDLKVSEKYIQHTDFHEQDDKLFLDALIYAEIVSHLEKAIERLPEGCQQICKLAYLDEKSNKEIAEHFNVSINTVKTQKRRALLLLRKQLNPFYRGIKNIFLLFF
ncbi:RNA polymerase sigma-70 factor [Sphingobacterium sp. BIGb0165]|uniref:RNA polymerase sigma-70 factor n=1 Tax=Sphingobacterium sp. BIGb0165 TaxID=2940615 RepID=UPI00216A6899|nr:RNA polymerase sigma-70 factor [Sphingobacterium sp. BIGb0165]MCS4225819.1 RNA polymerase sigma-70 factor (ECF subfamily) [Sphingobacterium sp. BIGb0165]